MPDTSTTLPKLFVLGQPRLGWPGGHEHVLERRDAALLAALALQGPVPRDRAIAWLWPLAERKAGQNNLRQRLFRLKQLAGQELVTSAAVLQLAEGLQHDLAGFGQQLPSTGGADVAEGELLGTLDYSDSSELADWVDEARAQWRQHRRKLLAQAAETHQREGRLAAALACTERLLRDDPGAELAHGQRMRLLYLQGDRAAALAAWGQCRRALREQADAEPSASLRELAELIQRSGPLPAPSLVAAPAAASAAQPAAALLRPPRLVGREAAWQALHQAWLGRQTVLLLGEPGIGKTRLLADFAQVQGLAAPLGARPGDINQPYALLQRLLRALLPTWPAPADWVNAEFARLLPELGTPAPGRLEPLRLQRAVAQALADWHGHGQGLPALVVDDMQFADAATLDLLLACLAPPHEGLPRLLLAARAAELPPALAAWRAEQPPGAVVEVRLAALSPPQIAELLDSLALPGHSAAEWAAPLAQRTGGNPLFILQLLQAAQGSPASSLQQLPADVGRLIEQRLALLSAAALRLARVAALAGPDFSLPLAADVLGVHAIDLADGLAELERGQLMAGAAFAYDLVAEAVLRTVPQAVAQLLHAGVARALQRKGAEPGPIAQHWLQAGEWAAAAAHFDQAAAQAQRGARRADEMAWADEARRCHLLAGDTGRAFAAGLRAAEAAGLVESPAQADKRMAALRAMAGDEVQGLQALLMQCQMQLMRADPAGVPTEEALSLAQRLGRPELVMRAASMHGVMLALGGQGDEALALLRPLLPQAEAVAGGPEEQHFFSLFAYVLAAVGRYQESLEPIRRAAAIAEREGDLAGAMTEYGNLSTMLGSLGDRDGAMQACEQALDLWRRLGEPVGIPAAALHMNMGMYCLGPGRFAQALGHFEWALAQFRGGDAGRWLPVTEQHLARLWLTLGQPARALQCLSPLAADATASSRLMRLEMRTRIEQRLGRASAAALQAALAEVDTTKARLEDVLTVRLRLASLLPPEEALPVCEALLQEAEGRHPPALQAARALYANVLRRLGRHDEAAAIARQALQGIQRSGSLMMPLTELCWLLLQAFEAAGARAEAQDALGRALAWLDGARPHVPPEFVESFCQRNPEHQQLLARRPLMQAGS